jgi:hypothetical protein
VTNLGNKIIEMEKDQPLPEVGGGEDYDNEVENTASVLVMKEEL